MGGAGGHDPPERGLIVPVGNRGPGRRATAQREEPHVSGLVDKDPVPPLVVGSVVLGVLAALGIFATGWLPWAMWPPSGEAVTGLLIASLVAALIGWASLAYGIVITAAKIDDLREMLRDRSRETEPETETVTSPDPDDAS